MRPVVLGFVLAASACSGGIAISDDELRGRVDDLRAACENDPPTSTTGDEFYDMGYKAGQDLGRAICLQVAAAFETCIDVADEPATCFNPEKSGPTGSDVQVVFRDGVLELVVTTEN